MATTNLEIFRAGTHTTASGETLTFSEGDLARIADAYEAASHEAPLVVGHPKDNAPAYGWTRALLAEGGKLRAVVGDIDASFVEGALRPKRYKKISASFYKPGQASNPKPEGYYLRHIGLLGAQPPAVKGLRDASFADGDGAVTIEFAEDSETATPDAPAATAEAPAESGAFTTAQIEALQKMIAAAVAAAKGSGGAAGDQAADHTEAADVVAAVEKVEGLTPEQLEALKAHIALAFEDAAKATPASGAAADAAPATVDASEGSEVTRLRAELASHKASMRAKARGAGIDALVLAGILTPAQKKVALSFAELVDGDAADFAEGDERPRSQMLCEDLLARFPAQVVTREVSGQADFADGERSVEAIAEAAVTYQSEQLKHGRVVHIADAVSHVTGRAR